MTFIVECVGHRRAVALGRLAAPQRTTRTTAGGAAKPRNRTKARGARGARGKGTDAAPERLEFEDVIAGLPAADLNELYRFWAGARILPRAPARREPCGTKVLDADGGGRGDPRKRAIGGMGQPGQPDDASTCTLSGSPSYSA